MYVASYDCSQIYIVCCTYSHCVFTIKLVQTSNAAKPTCARMSSVDLAGSERSTLMSGACPVYQYHWMEPEKKVCASMCVWVCGHVCLFLCH